MNDSDDQNVAEVAEVAEVAAKVAAIVAAKVTEPTREERITALLAAFSLQITKARAGICPVRYLKPTPDGRGGDILISAGSPDQARSAASALIYSGDGREWKFIGVGRDEEAGDDRYCAHLRVSPLP